MMQIPTEGLFYIATKEGIVPAPYLDPVNIWTFGIGHTNAAGAPDPSQMERGMPYDVEAAVRRAVRLYQQRIQKYVNEVLDAVTIPLQPHELSALVSFHYNTGGITRSDGTKRLNAGNKTGAWDIYQQWNKGTVNGQKVVLPGLVNRRHSERNLFFSGSYDLKPIPVYRVGSDHKIIYGSIVRSVNFEEFKSLLDVTVPIEKPPKPDLWVELAKLIWQLGVMFFTDTTPIKPKPEGKIVDRTPNGLPVYATAADYPWNTQRWPDFKPEEFDCKGTGRIALDPLTLDKLQQLRTTIGKPFYIVSGYRSPEHNRAVGGAPRSKHMEGIAFDIDTTRGINQERLKAEAERLGFNGIGTYGNFIHIDTRQQKARW
jgi:lysozyme